MKMVSERYHGEWRPAGAQATSGKFITPADCLRSASSGLGTSRFLSLFLLFLQLLLRRTGFFTGGEPRIFSCQALYRPSMGSFFIKDSLL